MCSLRCKNNLLTIEGVRFASILKKTPLSKLSFAFVSLAITSQVCLPNAPTQWYFPSFLQILLTSGLFYKCIFFSIEPILTTFSVIGEDLKHDVSGVLYYVSTVSKRILIPCLQTNEDWTDFFFILSKNSLKGQCHEIFCFWFFSSISFPPAPEYPIWTVSNFFENSWRYSQIKVDHLCRWHQWQMKKIFNQKNFNNFVGTPLDSRGYTYIHFCLQVHFKVSAAWSYSHCFATGVADTGGQPWAANISVNFQKNSKRP
jgi:hypothetical protein